MGKPILIALAPLGAAIVTNLVLKPYAEACSFGLSYSIVAIASLCWEIVAIPEDVTVTSPLHDDVVMTTLPLTTSPLPKPLRRPTMFRVLLHCITF